MRWRGLAVATAVVCLAAVPAGRLAALADVRHAFALVHAATGVNFRYAGPTTYLPTGDRWTDRTYQGGEPAEIVVAGVDARHPSTLMQPGGRGGGFSVRASWRSSGHLIGHVMGLGHSSLRTQTMYPVLQYRSAAAYGTYDLAGLARLGRRDGCVYVAGLWPDPS